MGIPMKMGQIIIPLLEYSGSLLALLSLGHFSCLIYSLVLSRLTIRNQKNKYFYKCLLKL